MPDELGRLWPATPDEIRRPSAELMEIAAREKWTAKDAVQVLRSVRLRKVALETKIESRV